MFLLKYMFMATVWRSQIYNYRTSPGLPYIIYLNKCEEISQKHDCCLNTFNISICSVQQCINVRILTLSDSMST